MSLDRPELRTRKPTAAVPWPMVLVEGEEKSGKSWAAADLTKSAKVGACYWLDLGEGSGDEYAAIPGTKYLVLEHDGTYASVLEQILAAKAEAAKAAAAGDPPVVLVVDSASDIWNGLKDWVSLRARNSSKNRAKLADDPAAELDVSRNLWNDAAIRYRRLTTHLLTFPGIVIVTARGKEVSATDPSTGQPYRDGRRDYSVESHKSLPYDATLWLRLKRTSPPVVIGARSVYAGIKPGSDEPQPITSNPDNLLEWLIFDVLQCNPGTAHVRDLKQLTGGELLEEERERETEETAGAKPTGRYAGADTPEAAAQQAADAALRETALERLGQRRNAARELLDVKVTVDGELVTLGDVFDGRRERLTAEGAQDAATGPQAAATPAEASKTASDAQEPTTARHRELVDDLVKRVAIEGDYDTVRAEWQPAKDAGIIELAIPPDALPHQLVETGVDLDKPVTVGSYLMAVGLRLKTGGKALVIEGPDEPTPAPPSDVNPLDAG